MRVWPVVGLFVVVFWQQVAVMAVLVGVGAVIVVALGASLDRR